MGEDGAQVGAWGRRAPKPEAKQLGTPQKHRPRGIAPLVEAPAGRLGRSIASRRSATVLMIVTIALAVSVITALFSVLDGLLLRPLPFAEPDRLAMVDWRPVDGHVPLAAVLPAFAERRRDLRARVLESPLVVDAAQADPDVFFAPDVARELHLSAQGVDSHFFPMLGLKPLLGGSFTREDERSPASASRESPLPLPIVIGYHLWRTKFGADPKVLGVRDFAERRVRIVGVMPPDVKCPDETNVWVAATSKRDWPPTYVRLAPAATSKQLAAQVPELRVRSVRDVAQPGRTGSLPLLFGAGGMLLLITWVQLAAFVFSRRLDNLREVGIRLALGASHLDIVRRVLLRSAAVAGAAFGLACLAVSPLTQFVVRWLPPEMSRGQYLQRDLRTFVFGCAVSLAGFLLLTVVPLAANRRVAPLDVLNGRYAERHGRVGRLRQTLLVTQMTLAALLLYLAGLAARSFAEAASFDFGFDAEHVVVFTFPRTMSDGRVPLDWADFLALKEQVRQSVDRVRLVPGVVGSANVFSGPLGIANQQGLTAIKPLDGLPMYGEPRASDNGVGSDFIDAIGARLIAGRGLDDRAYAGRKDVIVVNEALAGVLAPSFSVMGQSVGPSPIGRRIETVNGDGEVIGVLANFVDTRLDVPAEPQLFMPDPEAIGAGAVLIRTTGPVPDVLPSIRAALTSIWGPLRGRQFALLKDSLDPVLLPCRGQSVLLILVLACCVPIAAIGLMGALTDCVRLRTREIAIRIALGADANRVRRTVVRRALATAGLGIVFGTSLGVLCGRFISHQLFHVHPADVQTILGVTAGLLAIGWAAAVMPARVATRVLPADVLRQV